MAPGIQFAHTAAARFTGLPFIEIDKSEAVALTEAANDVFAQYDMTPSPAVAVWLQLVTVASAIYGPRLLMFQQLRAAERKEALEREANRKAEAMSDTGALVLN